MKKRTVTAQTIFSFFTFALFRIYYLAHASGYNARDKIWARFRCYCCFVVFYQLLQILWAII